MSILIIKMTSDLAIKVLEKEERFMVAKGFDALGIVSYLQFNNLVSPQSYQHQNEDKPTDSRKYYLMNGGYITINYNKLENNAQIILPIGLPESIANDLRQLGNESRERANKEKFGVSGMY